MMVLVVMVIGQALVIVVVHVGVRRGRRRLHEVAEHSLIVAVCAARNCRCRLARAAIRQSWRYGLLLLLLLLLMVMILWMLIDVGGLVVQVEGGVRARSGIGEILMLLLLLMLLKLCAILLLMAVMLVQVRGRCEWPNVVHKGARVGRRRGGRR